ncbi:MAG: LysR family transcriptional regulator, partial [Dorea sp.]
MTLNQLYYFQMIAKYENYRRAAEELYIAQPSLSRSIASLEKELGVLLFEKNGRGVSLTKGGRVFLEYADRIIRECEIAKNKMMEMASDGGKIDIGYVFPLAGHYIPHSVRDFLNKEENKNVTFDFFQNHTSAIAKKVESGELDVGFGGYMEKEEFEFFPVLSDEIVLITPKGHELENRKTVSIKEIENYPVIGY